MPQRPRRPCGSSRAHTKAARRSSSRRTTRRWQGSLAAASCGSSTAPPPKGGGGAALGRGARRGAGRAVWPPRRVARARPRPRRRGDAPGGRRLNGFAFIMRKVLRSFRELFWTHLLTAGTTALTLFLLGGFLLLRKNFKARSRGWGGPFTSFAT